MSPLRGWCCPQGQWTAVAFFLEQHSYLLRNGTLSSAPPRRQREREMSVSHPGCKDSREEERAKCICSSEQEAKAEGVCRGVILQLEL